MTDETALREAAEAATPGPWEPNKLLQVSQVADDPIIICEVTGARSDDQPHRDARFIALANPSAIIALLDTLAAEKAARERAEKELAIERITSDGLSRTGHSHMKRAEAAEAALAAAQAEVGRLREALAETRTDLSILKGNIANAAKSDARWDGMPDVVQRWIDRNDAALKEPT